MSCAAPWTGSKSDAPVRCGIRVRARGEADAAGDRAGQVREDVAEEIVGDDDAVALRGSRRGRCRRRRRAGSRPRRRDSSAPTSSTTRRQRSPANVSTLVLCTSVRRLPREDVGARKGVAHAALDAEARVDRALGCDLVRRAVAKDAALAGVGTLGVLAHDRELAALRRANPPRRERADS